MDKLYFIWWRRYRRGYIKWKKIVKLVYQNADKYDFHAINWSYSKGDTYDSVCIILTGNLSKIDNENFVPPKSITTFNKLYVALSRTKGDLYLIHKKNFDNYIKKTMILF